FIIVTHDQEEAMIVADRMAVMERGRIAQVGTPAEIYEQPNSRYVADFVGDVNLLEGHLAVSAGETFVHGSSGAFRVARPAEAVSGTPVWVALRPEKLRLGRDQRSEAGENVLAATVVDVGYRGSTSIYNLRTDAGGSIKLMVSNEGRVSEPIAGPEDRVWVSWPPEAGVVLTR